MYAIVICCCTLNNTPSVMNIYSTSQHKHRLFSTASFSLQHTALKKEVSCPRIKCSQLLIGSVTPQTLVLNVQDLTQLQSKKHTPLKENKQNEREISQWRLLDPHCCKIDTLQVRELLTEGRGETIFEVGVPLSGDPSCEDYSIGLKQGNIIFNLCQPRNPCIFTSYVRRSSCLWNDALLLNK